MCGRVLANPRKSGRPVTWRGFLRIWDEGGGARTLEYNRQPAGQVNYMITIGPDGRMTALRQVLNPQNFARVLPGMPMEQVRKMLGKPMKITPYALKRETHYDWRYVASPPTKMVFTVVFDADLRVARTMSVDEEIVNPVGRNR